MPLAQLQSNSTGCLLGVEPIVVRFGLKALAPSRPCITHMGECYILPIRAVVFKASWSIALLLCKGVEDNEGLQDWKPSVIMYSCSSSWPLMVAREPR